MTGIFVGSVLIQRTRLVVSLTPPYMYPPSHLAFGYLCYSAYAHIRWKHPPPGDKVLVLAFGTQFPDVVDKSLWWLGVWPYGRFIGHSLVIISMAALFLYFVTAVKHYRRRLIPPFLAGTISHSIADIIPKAIYGNPLGSDFGWVLWPLVGGTPSYRQLEDIDEYYSFPGVTHLADGLDVMGSLFSGEMVILWVVAGGVVWCYDGRPGMRELIRYLRRS